VSEAISGVLRWNTEFTALDPRPDLTSSLNQFFENSFEIHRPIPASGMVAALRERFLPPEFPRYTAGAKRALPTEFCPFPEVEHAT
jgi:hypothetical protein